MGVLIAILGFVVAFIAFKVVWLAGFMAGKDHEATMWLGAIDKITPPNWQSLLIGRGEIEDPEKLEMANRVYAAAYRTALDHIKMDIALIRREALEKLKAAEEEPRYPAV